MQWLQEIEERLNVATPGPWVWMESLDAVRSIAGDDYADKSPETVCAFHTGVGYESENADFISHSPTDIAKLIAAGRERETKTDF